MFKEFKEFAVKGNVVDLAIGVIIGAAFGKIVESMVNDVFMPIVGAIFGGLDFTNYFFQMAGAKAATYDAAKKAGATLGYGTFITVVVNFIIIAWILFMVVKAINRMKQRDEAAAAAPKAPPAPSREEELLTEIRDLLKK